MKYDFNNYKKENDIYKINNKIINNNNNLNNNFFDDLDILNENIIISNNIIDDFKKTIINSNNLINKIYNHHLLKYKIDKLKENNIYKNIQNENLNDLNAKYIYNKKDSNKLKYYKNDKNNDYIILNNKNKINFSDDIQNLKNINQEIANSNSNLMIENDIIESEIFRYKNKYKFNYSKPSYSYNNSFDESFKKFISNVKSSLKKNINENIELGNKIFSSQSEIYLKYQNFLEKISVYEKLIKKIKNKKKIISDIKKYNMENNKRYNNLLNERNILNNKLENIKIKLYDLKSKEKMLYLKLESSCRTKKDNEDLILKLNNTIKDLNDNINQKKGNINPYISNNSLIEYEEKIKNLFYIINKIEEEIKKINDENIKIRKDINKIKKVKNNPLTSELRVKLHELKINNLIIKNNLEDKEREINELKNRNNKDINIINNELLLKNNPYNTTIKNQEIDNKFDIEIKEALKTNIDLINEIKSITEMYDSILYKKEQEISLLEKNLKLNEYPNLNVDDKIKSFNNKNNNNNLKGNKFGNILKNNYNENIDEINHDENNVNSKDEIKFVRNENNKINKFDYLKDDKM